jgi:hypothetical protein
MTHEIRKRIYREATPEEKERLDEVRERIAPELPALKQWAREAADRVIDDHRREKREENSS